VLQCVATERLDTFTDHFRKRVDEATDPHHTISHPCCNTLTLQHTHTDPFRDRANEATDPDHIITFVVGGGNYVEVCCGVLQCVVAVCCSLVQCVAVFCRVLQCVVYYVCYTCGISVAYTHIIKCKCVLQCVAVCCSALQCVAV